MDRDWEDDEEFDLEAIEARQEALEAELEAQEAMQGQADMAETSEEEPKPADMSENEPEQAEAPENEPEQPEMSEKEPEPAATSENETGTLENEPEQPKVPKQPETLAGEPEQPEMSERGPEPAATSEGEAETLENEPKGPKQPETTAYEPVQMEMFRNESEHPEAHDPETDWEAVVEAVLFTMGSPVEIGQLAAAIGQDADMAKKVVENLAWRYDHENRGMQVIRLEDSYQLCTRGRFYENLIRVAAAPKRHVLTDVALETLSIIAYKQPVTRAEIEKIRGVNSDHAVNRLVEYGLVEEIGRLDAPGRPALFATTEEFLRRFGIGSRENLPDMDPVRAEEIRSEVEEELQVDLQELEQDEAEPAQEPENGAVHKPGSGLMQKPKDDSDRKSDDGSSQEPEA